MNKTNIERDLSIINDKDWFVVNLGGVDGWLAKGNIISANSKPSIHWSKSSNRVYDGNKLHLCNKDLIKSIRFANTEEIKDFYQKHPKYINYFGDDEWKKITDTEKLEKTLKNIESIVKSTLITSAAIKASSIIFKEGSALYEKSTTATEKVIYNKDIFKGISELFNGISKDIESKERAQKKEITHKINKIETKLSKLNDKREKLLERYKSLGR